MAFDPSINKDKLQNKMTLKQFREYCDAYDCNLSNVIPKSRFRIQCIKCGSLNVQILFNNKEISGGSEYTGDWTSQDSELVFKCIKCGNAIGIIGVG